MFLLVKPYENSCWSLQWRRSRRKCSHGCIEFCMYASVKHSRHEAMCSPNLLGISRSSAGVLRRRPNTVCTPITKPSNRSLQLRQRQLCSPLNSIRHTACELPRQYLQVPSTNMVAAVLPARAANGIRKTGARHGDKTRSACERRWKDISPLSGRLEQNVGQSQSC